MRPSRSASGFRLMNMRPWLTEALKPEAPTEEPTAADGRIGQHDVERLALQLQPSPRRRCRARPACEPNTRPVSSCGK